MTHNNSTSAGGGTAIPSQKSVLWRRFSLPAAGWLGTKTSWELAEDRIKKEFVEMSKEESIWEQGRVTSRQ